MSKITWDYCQENSDLILADGLLKLISSDIYDYSDIKFTDFGNYLISHEDRLYYIGEARSVHKRTKQQFRLATSTFYKNYLKLLERNKTDTPIRICDFSIRYIPTTIGRKEIEDFGIVNMGTPLNKFQIGKRNKIELKHQKGLWDKVQNQWEKLLMQGEAVFFDQECISWFDCQPNLVAGLYMVKHRKNIIYIGESSDISERHATHSNDTYFSALRRHIGTEILKYQLQERKGKRKYFTDQENSNVTKFLKNTSATFHPVSFGRYELEEYLINKHKPLLNRKDNND